MARVLICHVPKDGSIARDLGSALMGRGHFVSFDGEPDDPRPDRSSRLRQFEAVLVVWTETSVNNAVLADIAREMLPLNLLVPVRSESLAAVRLPLELRKLNMHAPRDIDGIARAVARISAAASTLRDMTERDASRRKAEKEAERKSGMEPKAKSKSAPASASERPASPIKNLPPKKETEKTEAAAPPPVVENATAVKARPLLSLPEVEVSDLLSPLSAHRDAGAFNAFKTRKWVSVPTADDLASAIDGGLIVRSIPTTLRVAEAAVFEFALNRHVANGAVEAEVPFGSGQDRQAIETLSISLYGDADVIEIERQSERTQFVSQKQALAARDPETFGIWSWLVTPRSAGIQTVTVRISAVLRDRQGVPAPVALPDSRIEISIEPAENTGVMSAIAGWYRR